MKRRFYFILPIILTLLVVQLSNVSAANEKIIQDLIVSIDGPLVVRSGNEVTFVLRVMNLNNYSHKKQNNCDCFFLK